MLPSLSTPIPWGNRSMPDPKLFRSLPAASNLRMGSSVLPAQLLAPHRSATQMLWPSRSMSTALVDPQVLPSGSLAQFSIVRYGLGAEFSCAHKLTPIAAIPAATHTCLSLIGSSPDSLHQIALP